MPLKRGGPTATDPLVWDLTLCARRALKRAAKAERIGKHQVRARRTKCAPKLGRGDTVLSSTGGESLGSFLPNPNKRTTLSVSHDSLALKHWGAGDRRNRIDEFVESRKSTTTAKTQPAPILHCAGELPALIPGRLSAPKAGQIIQRQETDFVGASVSSRSVKRTTKWVPERELSKKEVMERLKTSPFFSPLEQGQDIDLDRDLRKRKPKLVMAAVPVAGLLRLSEKTGPTNWSVEDLHGKYRNELVREDAYTASMDALKLQADMARRNVIVGAVRVVRHPLLVFSDKHIEAENVHCLGRARMRCVARRFVLDVHQIWLTNLDHLEAANVNMSRHPRIDDYAIIAVKSQIQSVAPKHMWRPLFAWADASKLPGVTQSIDPFPPLPPPVALKLRPVTVSLLAGEPLVFREVCYEVSVDRRFFAESTDQPAKWRIGVYDPLTGTEVTAVNHEDTILKHVLVPKNEGIGLRRKAKCKRLVHKQGCLIREQVSSIACVGSVYACTPRSNDADRSIFFDLVFVAGAGHPFRIARHRLEALDVVAQLGLNHAPLTNMGWWCQRGQTHIYSSLLDQFWFGDDAIQLRVPSSDSSLSYRFDFRHLVKWTLALLPIITLDISRPGKERLIYAATERSVDYGRREEDWRPVDGYCYADDARGGGFKTVPDWDDNNNWQVCTQSAPSLSMTISGAKDCVFEVPGATAIGPCGLPFAIADFLRRGNLSDQAHGDPARDHTKAVAILSRLTSGVLQSIIINIGQAPDFLILAPKHISWDNANLNPPDVFQVPKNPYIPLM